MAAPATTPLVDALRQYHLLESAQGEEVARNLAARFPDPKALAGELIRREWLTPYQANHLLQRRGHELLLGSYILLERVGEGGMGQVFKAKNWKLGRVVALKLIRKDRLGNPDTIRRFEREVRAAAALTHPHIVHAHDADQIDGTHILVMEYVEGACDLNQWVKNNGPLPVMQACEYIRQAALGLQHAFERGVVHRDIKPANLLRTADGRTVKILDMGLARLDHAGVNGEHSSTMTQEGTFMGTADYMAPEQTLDSHSVDIRADLYSLGCTFYFLLSGKVPFPGGSLGEKIAKHQMRNPEPVERLRAEVPAGVAAVVRKLLAKQPGERYQTPAEVAAVLAANPPARSLADGNAAGASEETPGSALEFMAQTGDTEGARLPQRVRGEAGRHWRLAISVACGLLIVVGGLVLFFHLFKEPAETSAPPLVVTNTPFQKPPSRVDDAWLKQVAALPPGQQVEAVAKKLRALNPHFDGKVTHKVEKGVVTHLQFHTDKVTDLSPVKALRGLRGLECSSGKGKGLLANLSPLKGMKLTDLGCGGTQVSDLSPLRGMPLTTLYCPDTKVADLSPLKGMRLTYLNCNGTRVSDLSPLKGMPLTYMRCEGTKVSDLVPLQGMKLATLNCRNTPVFDLSPLKGMKLTTLYCASTKVSDLSPLKGMPLISLLCDHTPVTDLSLLKGIPLQVLSCDFRPDRDTALLRSMKTLTTINGKLAKAFWKEVDAKKP